MKSTAVPITKPTARITREWLLESLIATGELDELARVRVRARADTVKAPAVTFFANAKFATPDGGILDGERLADWLAKHSGLAIATINPLKINVDSVTAVMSQVFAKTHNILCLEVRPNELVVGVADPFDTSWVANIEHTSRRKVSRVVVDATALERYLGDFYALSKSIAGANANKANQSTVKQGFEQLVELNRSDENSDTHIANIVDWLLQYAFDQRASDIHVEPRRQRARVRFRIDGMLQTVYDLPADVNTSVTSRLKVLGRMDVAEKRKPQDGRIKTKTPSGAEVELRLSTLPTAFGEKLVIRIFDPEVLLKDFTELGIPQRELGSWKDLIAQPHGIVLVTGPTGSGKTTTLYTTLKSLATDEVNVSTIEDPIEMVEDSFNQMQVQSNIGLDFASGVKTLLRQDPDIIMVGEIRDRETAEMAVQAALTGHLVLSTLHTNDSASAVSRLLEFGVPHYLLKSTIIGVMAQRLVRVLCNNCKVAEDVSDEKWRDLCAPFKLNKPERIYRQEGCKSCRNTGYSGRKGLYELMTLDEGMRALIDERTDVAKLKQQAVRSGMKPLRVCGALAVASGHTTIDEVYRVAPKFE